MLFSHASSVLDLDKYNELLVTLKTSIPFWVLPIIRRMYGINAHIYIYNIFDLLVILNAFSYWFVMWTLLMRRVHVSNAI